MRIIYLGPSPFVHVPPYPDHSKGDVVDYPDDFALDLVENSRRQEFAVDDGRPDQAVIATSKPIDEMTVPELKDLLDSLEVAYTSGDRKADLINLVVINTAEPPAEE